LKILTVLIVYGSLGTCAFAHAPSSPTAPPEPATKLPQPPKEGNLSDPFEPMNRGVLRFNRTIDGLILKPAATLYHAITPAPARAGVANALNNLAAPLVSVNLTFQGEGKKAGRQFGRFLINSTLGIGGLFDVAKTMGLSREDTDFDHTMAKAGVPSGPYIILPLLGPATPRAIVGRVAQVIADPFNRVMIHEGHRNYIYIRSGTQIISARDQSDALIEVLESDTYMYETMRSIYSQVVRIKEGKQAPNEYQGPKPSDDWGQPIPTNESQKNENIPTPSYP
jgi:phospholipid-binding lipoprotein MlaA